MPLENTATAIAFPEARTIAAPRREKRLVPAAPKPRTRPAVAVLVPTHRPATCVPQMTAVESKVAALQDPADILKVLHTEATLRRAQRLSGHGDAQRQTIRLLSICMLFALLAAAIGAGWYLQTSLQASRRTHHPAAVGTPAMH